MHFRRLDPRRTWALAIIAASVAVYAPTLGHGFVYDDNIVVVSNKLIRSLGQIPTLILSREWQGAGIGQPLYRPLTDLTYALNYAAAGLSPWSYHATNIVLHALAAALLFAVGLRLGLGLTAAGAGALLFGIHPIHVEAVANVVGRKEVLATVFALAMVLLHRRALVLGGPRLAWPVLAFAASMLSKENGVVAVGFVALHDLVVARPGGVPVHFRRRLTLYAGYALALAAYMLLYRTVLAGSTAPATLDDNVTAHASTTLRLMTAVAVIGKGLALQAVPVNQSPDWSYQAITLVTSPADPRFLAAVGALVVWLSVGIVLRRRAPEVLVGLAWYVGALFPVSNIPFAIGTIFGERLLYLPSAGLALVAGSALSALAARIPRAAVLVPSLGAALALCLATVSYSLAWKDGLRLFRLASVRVPRSSSVHSTLSSLLLEHGDASSALNEAERAIALNTWNARGHMMRALALHDLGRFEEEKEARRAALTHASTGNAEVQLQAHGDQEVHALQVAAQAGDADALYRLACVARDEGRLADAADLWQRAIAANPRHTASLTDLAAYHLLNGRTNLAIELCLRAVDVDAKSPGAWYNLALAYRARGDAVRSRAAFRRFVETAGTEYAQEVEAVRRMLDDQGR